MEFHLVVDCECLRLMPSAIIDLFGLPEAARLASMTTNGRPFTKHTISGRRVFVPTVFENLKFFGECVAVVLWIVPIDDLNSWRMLLAIDEFSDRNAKRELVIDNSLASKAPCPLLVLSSRAIYGRWSSQKAGRFFRDSQTAWLLKPQLVRS